MNEFEQQLESFAEDLATIEASVIINNQAVAYSKIEYEGDCLNWLADQGDDEPLTKSIAQLQQTQLEVGSTARCAVLSLTATLIKSLMT